ncbi:MAG TPA: acyl-CoA thioesterase [Gammaproteobacteria bacterium]|nr:acyl-CoA thioesterase [Gammaproteobacteria bacterium]
MLNKPRGNLSIQITAMPADTNGNGDIFGGWLVSHMDLAGSCEASLRSRTRVVTVAINSMTFIRPVSVGDIVCCYTELLKVGRTSMQINIEVWTMSLRREDKLKVAEGIFTYVAIDDQGKPQPVDKGLT